MNRADLRVALLAQIIARRLDVFCRATERHKHRVRVLGFVILNQPVAPAGELRKLLAALLDEAEDGLVEIIPARDHAVHVMFLVLHRPEQHGIFQIHHLRHAPPLGPE